MPTLTLHADQVAYSTGSTWTFGKARQGVYGSSRYEGAIHFAGMDSVDWNSIVTGDMVLTVTLGPAGGTGTKYLQVYKATGNAISGHINDLRGDFIGQVELANAYSTTIPIHYYTTSPRNPVLAEYFKSGGQTLVIYVPETRGMYDRGYCYDYLQITAATLEIDYVIAVSSGVLSSSSVVAGNSITLNITPHDASYSHKVTWAFGSNSYAQSVAAGVTSTSYTIPTSWLSAIPSSSSGTATVKLETIGPDGSTIGQNTYSFTVQAPDASAPTIGSIAISPVNTNSYLSSWGVCAQGMSRATISIQGAQGVNGSSITSYSITTSPNIGSSQSASLTTDLLTISGNVTITATVTDSRGKICTQSRTFTVYPYGGILFTNQIEAYRCTSSGTRNDTGGTYVRLYIVYPAPNSIQYCTTVKQNADIIQALAHMSGRSCVIKTKPSANTRWKSSYVLDIWLTPGNCHEILTKPTVHEYCGKVYCAVTQTGYFLVRRNGKVWITGNSGRLVQLQNVPQNHLPDLRLARDIVKRSDEEQLELLFGSVPGTLSELIRTAFIPKDGCRFIVADFSAIEARVLAWLAGEEWVLDEFRGNGKIYEATASRMFHVPQETIVKGHPNYEYRQKGKQATLSCIAEGQLVLTDQGLVPIEQVQLYHKVWDGENWVSHEGVQLN